MERKRHADQLCRCKACYSSISSAAPIRIQSYSTPVAFSSSVAFPSSSTVDVAPLPRRLVSLLLCLCAYTYKEDCSARAFLCIQANHCIALAKRFCFVQANPISFSRSILSCKSFPFLYSFLCVETHQPSLRPEDAIQ